MKKSLIALAVLAASGAAMAQSSVTLFGVVDATVRYVDGGTNGNIWSLTNSGYNSSRLGFRGTEDLGGGLSASFWLEAGVNNDNGTGSATSTNNTVAGSASANTGTQGLTFNRRSTVSLAGTWGEVRLGRDFVPYFLNTTIFDPFGTNGVGGVSNFTLVGLGLLTGNSLNSTAAGVRASNSIGYFMPNLGGFYGQAMIAMGENNDSLANGNSNPFKSDGNIGSVRRMEYTVLGDPVNLASRLESMTKDAKVDILIDGNTRHRLGNLIKCRKVEHSGVRGKMQEIEIFSLDELLVR